MSKTGTLGGAFQPSADYAFSGNPTFSGTPTFSGAPAFTGTPTFSNPVSVTPAETKYAASGAITIVSGLATITLGSAAAMTLAAPTAAQEGTLITITSQTAYAHVVTATGLLNNGTTGGPHNTATFAAYVGATIQLVAVNQQWNVVSASNVTIA